MGAPLLALVHVCCQLHHPTPCLLSCRSDSFPRCLRVSLHLLQLLAERGRDPQWRLGALTLLATMACRANLCVLCHLYLLQCEPRTCYEGICMRIRAGEVTWSAVARCDIHAHL